MYLKNKIYTMPQFLAQRYNDKVSTIMAVFWLLVYVFVNLTSIIYFGAIAISSISPVSFEAAIVGLSVFSIIVTLGGMKVIGYTDVIQVLVLIIGGLVTTYLALSLLADKFGFDGDILKGLGVLRKEASGHFHMILDKSNPHYKELPGISVLIGGMLVNNLAYWGCNQYIVQRALGADLKTARSGILFAAFLKLLIPVIAVLPGITMYVLHSNGMFQKEMVDTRWRLKTRSCLSYTDELIACRIKRSSPLQHLRQQLLLRWQERQIAFLPFFPWIFIKNISIKMLQKRK